MKTYPELTPYIESKDYKPHLWNALQGRHSNRDVLASGLDLSGNAHALPSAAHDKYMAALKKESLFRNLATEIHAYDTDYRIKTVQNEGVSAWVPEGGAVTVSDDMSDFGEIWVTRSISPSSCTMQNPARSPSHSVTSTITGSLADSSVCIRPLVEKYIAIDCIGYRAYEFLDGKFVRPEAIKVMQMTDNAA